MRLQYNAALGGTNVDVLASNPRIADVENIFHNQESEVCDLHHAPPENTINRARKKFTLLGR